MNIPANPDVAPAHALWVELATRTATQQLHYRAGGEEATARSLFALFPLTRKLLAEHPAAAGFRAEAVRMLNETLRPYTARWHSWMVGGGNDPAGDGVAACFPDEGMRRLFRKELRALQDAMNNHRDLFAEMAGITDSGGTSAQRRANLGAPGLRCGVGAQVMLRGLPEDKAAAAVAATTGRAFGAVADRERADELLVTHAVAERINAVESAAVLERRRQLGRATAEDRKLLDATGLALSGGGIRSATFCLGIVQVLVRRRMFLEFDYLSTVSGGGYLGSFLSCALGTERSGMPWEAEARLDSTFERVASGTESGLLRHLRNHSKFLLDGGLKTKLQIAGQLLSGALWNGLILAPVPLFAALGAWVLGRGGYWGESPGSSPWPQATSPSAVVAVFFLAAVVLGWALAPLVQSQTVKCPPRSGCTVFRNAWEWATILLGLFAAGAWVLHAIPALIHGYGWLGAQIGGLRGAPAAGAWDWDVILAAATGGGTVVLGLVGTWLTPRVGRLRACAVKLFIFAGPLLALWVFLLAAQGMAPGGDTAAARWHPGWVLLVAVAATVWSWAFVNINTLAPHRFYRSRLCSCYLTRRIEAGPAAESGTWLRTRFGGANVQGKTESLQRVTFAELGKCAAAPYHLINTTVNLPGSTDKELRGRSGDFFVVSRDLCGAPTTGYVSTPGAAARDGHFDLGTAMAVSGAAASTNMGWKTLPYFRFVMTLLNVRLGYWLRRPDSADLPWLLRWIDRPGPQYLWRELLGNMSERCRYLNLSDGGHIENLAVYELLRRRCKFIVCVDGGQDQAMQCDDLIRLQRYAEIDLGLRMTYDLTDLRLRENRLSRAYGILVKIEYPKTDGTDDAPELGWMLYLKLAMTGTEPPYVVDYRRENPAFPHQSTGDQLFDEAQFEAYRRLGECAAESFFSDEIVGPQDPANLRGWFQLIANHQLPENDSAMEAAARP